MKEYSISKLKSLLFRTQNSILTARMELKEIRNGEETMFNKNIWENVLANSYKEQSEIEKELLLRGNEEVDDDDDEFLDSIIKG